MQKEIGLKRKVSNSGELVLAGRSKELTPRFSCRLAQNKEDATELQAEKASIEAEAAALVTRAAEAEASMRKKGGLIGNIVHESVPISETEVSRVLFL